MSVHDYHRQILLKFLPFFSYLENMKVSIVNGLLFAAKRGSTIGDKSSTETLLDEDGPAKGL